MHSSGISLTGRGIISSNRAPGRASSQTKPSTEDMPMPKFAIYREILIWSADRPAWQQDALRRLVTQEHIDQADIADLVSLCKAKYGLEDHKDAEPLNRRHLPTPAAAGSAVTLTHLTHQIGVNALAPDQTLRFGPNLTIVYGHNGAGKSGYVRVLKRACRARGAAEPILGDVTSAGSPPVPSALIRYSVGGESTDFRWRDSADADRPLSRVSVFDRQCASVYINKRTDVAFRPMGLDLFDRLATVSEDVRKVLDSERKDLQEQEIRLPTVPSDTPVAALLDNLTALTDLERLGALSSLSKSDLHRMGEIRAHLKDTAAEDPQAASKALSLRAERLSKFLDRLIEVSAKLSDSSIRDLLEARNAYRNAKAAIERRSSAFESMPVAGVGSPAWRRLWDAAREFFLTEAYPSESHPSEDALCVLCQQPHSHSSFKRMQELERHASSEAQANYEEAEKAYLSAQDDIERARLSELDAIDEVSIDNPGLAHELTVSCEYLNERRDSILAALGGNNDMEFPMSSRGFDYALLRNHIDGLHGRATVLTAPTSKADLEALRKELDELESRETLRNELDLVTREIRRKQRIAVYQQCIEETRTHAITRKSTDLTKKAVTGRLVQAFTDELKRLRFAHVEVDLVEAGGSNGALYHRLALRRAPGTEVAEVVSEGEARCLSIASFFAELSTADDRSAILFDDPVSSLDQTWRDSVANRLVAESAERQVIVFTHDMVFFRALWDRANQDGVDAATCYLRRTSLGAGFTADALPTPMLKVSSRVRYLNKLWQDASVLFERGEQDEYERKGREMYGLLREAWERGVEEVLLSGVVERFRLSVQTQNRIMELSDISMDDCVAVQRGMSKCSTFLQGHDKSPADNRPFPEPSEVKDDIDALASWIETIRNRRN